MSESNGNHQSDIQRMQPIGLIPYKGLMPYQEEDANFFFGREPEKEIITANLIASRLTVFYGASGVGKSSVLRAGVVRHLQEQAERNLKHYGLPEFVVVAFSSWRDDPITGLAASIEKSVKSVFGGKEFEPLPPTRCLSEILQAWTERVGGELLIILDQFEEFFLYHGQEDGEGTFAFEFARAVNRSELHANFIISIREDSLAKIDYFKGRINNLFDNYLRIEHLSHDAAREAIKKPVAEYNKLYGESEGKIEIEKGLVSAVLNQLETGKVFIGQSGQGTVEASLKDKTSSAGARAGTQIETPYLQLVMLRLWQEERRAASSVLRLNTLKELGGAERIVRTHLDEAMNSLPRAECQIALNVFRYLVTPSGTKIAHTIPDLAEYAGVSTAQLTPVINKLTLQSRILRRVSSPSGKDEATRYEIFHDVLAAAILDWQMRQRLTAERARVRRLHIALALALIAAFGTLIFAALYVKGQRKEQALKQERQQTERANNLAKRAKDEAPNDPELGLLLAIKALKLRENETTVEALRDLLRRPLRVILFGHEKQVHHASFSPDGAYVVTASDDKTARIWDTQMGLPIITLPHPEGVFNAVYSPDGKWIATTCKDNNARIWAVGQGDSPVAILGRPNSMGDKSKNTTHKQPLLSIAFSSDSNYIVTSSEDNTAKVWKVGDWEQSEPLATLTGHENHVLTAAFSPDGKEIVTASRDKSARIWRKTDEHKWVSADILSGHESVVFRAVFSPDGEKILTASEDNSAWIWEKQNNHWQHVQSLPPQDNNIKIEIEDANFDKEGKHVVIVGRDKSITIFEVGNRGGSLRNFGGHDAEIFSADFSPNDNSMVVTASADYTARIWKWQTDPQETSGDAQQLIKLAQERVTRDELTQDEKEKFLSD